MEYQGNYTVYMHVHKRNGKKYIGITKQSVNERWNSGKGYSPYQPFGLVVFEEGWDSFEHVILNKGVTKELALKLEDFYIEYFRTYEICNGYNVKINNGRNITPKQIKTGMSGKDIHIDYDGLKEFAKTKNIICIKQIWKEYFKYAYGPTRLESKEIAIQLNKFDFLEKKNTTFRVLGYGACKVWEYK